VAALLFVGCGSTTAADGDPTASTTSVGSGGVGTEPVSTTTPPSVPPGSLPDDDDVDRGVLIPGVAPEEASVILPWIDPVDDIVHPGPGDQGYDPRIDIIGGSASRVVLTGEAALAINDIALEPAGFTLSGAEVGQGEWYLVHQVLAGPPVVPGDGVVELSVLFDRPDIDGLPGADTGVGSFADLRASMRCAGQDCTLSFTDLAAVADGDADAGSVSVAATVITCGRAVAWLFPAVDLGVLSSVPVIEWGVASAAELSSGVDPGSVDAAPGPGVDVAPQPFAEAPVSDALALDWFVACG
jgi:hypothetical protein